jgi:plasmid stabilization system protein ParE
MKIEYHAALEGELRAIRDFYDGRSTDLGKQFLDEFERQVLLLAASPERWMIVTRDVRRCLMHRFPYIIYFKQLGEKGIRILIVKHQRRHPQFGRERS